MFGDLPDAERAADIEDDHAVVPDREAKSISHETTFAADIADVEALRAWARAAAS